MAQNDKLDHWLPMPEVLTRTGLSQRTVYRMVSDGRLKQAQRPMPGRCPLPVFDPDSVAEIVASAAESPGKPQSPAEQGPLLPPSELSFKLYLTEEEAIRYTGFGRAHLRAYGKGRTIGPHGARVYRRVDLEKL